MTTLPEQTKSANNKPLVITAILAGVLILANIVVYFALPPRETALAPKSSITALPRTQSRAVDQTLEFTSPQTWVAGKSVEAKTQIQNLSDSTGAVYIRLALKETMQLKKSGSDTVIASWGEQASYLWDEIGAAAVDDASGTLEALRSYMTWQTPEDLSMITLEEFANSPTLRQGWIVDTKEGWLYWGAPVAPGESVPSPISSVTLEKKPKSGDLKYDLVAESEFITGEVGVDGFFDNGVAELGQNRPEKQALLTLFNQKDFVFTLDTSLLADQTFIPQIPDSPSNDFTIYYGDGNSLQASNDNRNQPHRYEKEGLVTVRVAGNLPSGMTFADEKALVAVHTAFLENTVSSFANAFSGCENLKVVPTDLFDASKGATDFSGTFAGCEALQAIPVGLFDQVPSAESFQATFARCTSLSTIPEGLFNATTNLDQNGYDFTFDGCILLSEIPTNLFAQSANVTGFTGTFQNCTGLTTLPSDLFSKNVAVDSFVATFVGCTALSEIPENLFASNTDVTLFQNTFSGCDSVVYVPSNLFASNTKVQFFSGTFSWCMGLRSLPVDGLFTRNTNVEAFYNTFYGCTALAEIPVNLFEKNTNVTAFNGTFAACDHLQFVPDGLFLVPDATDASNFTPRFDKLVSLRAVFENCTGLIYEAPPLWNYYNLENFDAKNAFTYCVSVPNWSEIPASWGGFDDANSPA